MIGVKVIRKLAKNCGAERPTLLTSTKFRKHIATTLQLMNMQPEEMEQLATFMGHTKKTHAEFYRLPQDVYQTAKVAKVLLLLEKGRGKNFQGKTINEIQLKQDIYYSSNSSEDEDKEEVNTVVKKLCKRMTNRNVLKRKEGNLKEQTVTDLDLSKEKRQENRKKINTMQICKDNLMDGNESDTDEVTEPEIYASRTNKERKKINTEKGDAVNTCEDSVDNKRMSNTNLLERMEGTLKERTATDLHLSKEKKQDNRKKIDTMYICKDNLMISNESYTDEITEPENYASRTNNKRKKITIKKGDTVNTCEDSLESNESDNDEVTELKRHASRINNKKKKNHKIESPKEKKIVGRIRWLQKEKEIVLEYFKKHVQNKITPKKHECNQFLVTHGKQLHNKDWVRIKTFVYNSFKGN